MLYQKYRPKTWEEVKGNEQTVMTLKSLLRSENPPHAFLLHGPTGCGKTTLARLIAKELGCSDFDYHEIDVADYRGIDTVRDLRAQAQFLPLVEGGKRVWVLDECHKLTNDAMNALLKLLEEPPAHSFFVLCTTDPQNLLPTIRSRCVELEVKPLSQKDTLHLLFTIANKENEKVSRALLERIVQISEGLPRTALQLLEQVLTADPNVREQMEFKTTEKTEQVVVLCRALLQLSPWKKVSSILKSLEDEDPEAIRRRVLGYCRKVLMDSENDVAAAIIEAFMQPFYNTGWTGLVYACYSLCSPSSNNLGAYNKNELKGEKE